MWSHIFLFGSLPRRRPPEFTAILMFEFWREATATSVPVLLCQSRRRRPENVSFLSSLMTRAKDSTTRRHGTDATKIIDNNQITRRNNFRSEEVFPRPWNVAIDYVPDVTPYPRIRIFFNRQRFFLRIRFPSTRIRWIRPAYESATFWIRSLEWNFWIRSESRNLWTLDPEFFYLVT